MMPVKHIHRAIDADLQGLARIVAEMGGLAERQITEAIEALVKRDGGRASRIIASDTAIDALQRTIEERAIGTIARRQPVANDLRHIVGILRIANELERIGDLAKNIAKRVIVIAGEDTPRRPMGGVRHMAALMLGQLQDVLDSFARGDVAKAVEVWTRDQELDRLCRSVLRELLAFMIEKPVFVTLAIHLLFCTKNLERMGDHATNIAESVYYMVQGELLSTERPKADVTNLLPHRAAADRDKCNTGLGCYEGGHGLSHSILRERAGVGSDEAAVGWVERRAATRNPTRPGDRVVS